MNWYKPYPAYKDSGVEWLGEVPVHWDVFPLKRLARTQLSNVDKHTVEGEKFIKLCNYLDVYKNERITSNMNFMSATASEEQIKRLSIQHDDILMTKDSEMPDDIGVPALVAGEIEGVVCGYHLALLRPRPELCVGGYLARLLTSTYIQAQFATSAVGLTRYGLGKYDIDNVLLPVPSIYEQTTIATFLDRETAKLDTLIAKQEKLIELLQEKRQALISHAVTKGLNPDAPIKDSGVEWLGGVPEHWRIGKCGYYISILSGFAFPSSGFSNDEKDTKLLRGINVGVSQIRWDETVYWRRAEGDGLDVYELQAGEIVIGMDRPLIREGIRVSKIREADLPCLLLQRVAALKMRDSLYADFLHFLLSSRMFEAHFIPDTTGVSVPHISPEQIASFVVPIPPLNEQKEVIDYLACETTKLDTLIEKSRRSIDLMREHRTALISAAVTGKIDVREAT